MKPAPTHALQLPFGFIVWSVWFVAMYGGLAVGCALAPPPPAAGALTWLNGALAALTVLTCGWLLGRARRCWRAATLGGRNAGPVRADGGGRAASGGGGRHRLRRPAARRLAAMRVALRLAPGALAAAAQMASAWMAAAQTASAHGPLPAVPPAVAADSLPTLLVAFVLAAGWFAYLAGARRVPPRAWQRRALGAALAIGALSLLGPIERWAQPGAAAHMLQHMLLIAVVAPLAVLAQPWPQWQAALGAGARGVWRTVAPAVRRPLVAAALHGALIWMWHTPRAYGLALENPWWHVLEHASFVVSAWLFWHAVLRAAPREEARALLALFLTSLHTGLLGALLTFARAPLYADAVSLADQQLAGLIMWVPGGGAYLAAAAWCGQRWLHRLWRRRAPD